LLRNKLCSKTRATSVSSDMGLKDFNHQLVNQGQRTGPIGGIRASLTAVYPV